MGGAVVLVVLVELEMYFAVFVAELQVAIVAALARALLAGFVGSRFGVV